MLSSSHCNNWNLKASVRELQRRCMKMCEERDALDLMLEERENRIKSANLEQEEFQKTFQEKEMAIQQKLGQLEQDWRAKLERVMEERSKHEQCVKKEIQALLLKLFKTERLHQTQICDYEVKYRDSLKLVCEQQRQIEEREANRGVTFILLSLMTRLGSPKDALTLQPNLPLFFTGETVSLRCSGRPYKHHGFLWYRYESNIPVTKNISKENIYTIAPVTEAHSGVYMCSGESDSGPVRLNVSALPKATLMVEPKWRPLYNGETVTLRCEVDSYSNWTYSWYKDQTQMAVSQTAGHSVTGNRLTIPRAAGSDQGQYWCEGKLEGRNVTSQRSDSINLTVAALPKPTLEGRNVTSQPSDSLIKQQGSCILLFGLGAAPLLLASIILCVKWCRRPGSSNEAAVKYTEQNVEVDL